MYSLSAVIRIRARVTLSSAGISNGRQKRTVWRSNVLVSQIHAPISLKLCEPRSARESFTGSDGSSSSALTLVPSGMAAAVARGNSSKCSPSTSQTMTAREQARPVSLGNKNGRISVTQ